MNIDFPKKILALEVRTLYQKIIRQQVNLSLLHFLKIFHAEDDCILLTKLASHLVYHKIVLVTFVYNKDKLLPLLDVI